MEENSRYTVADGTSDRSLMTSIVVAAASEEQNPGRLDDRGAGQAGPCLADGADSGPSSLDAGRHTADSTAPDLRVLLSNIESPAHGSTPVTTTQTPAAAKGARLQDSGLGRLAGWCPEPVSAGAGES